MYIRIIKMLLFFIFISLSIESHANWIGKMIEAIPGKPAEGVADYLEIVGLNPDRAKNTDIRRYNKQLVENSPCMRSLATQFYVSLTAEGVSEEYSVKTLQKPLPNAVALSETTESMGREPGWLWKKALDLTKGNKTLALQILSLCGHDDRVQMNGYEFPLTEKQRATLVEAGGKITSEARKILIQRNTNEEIEAHLIPLSGKDKEAIFLENEKRFSEALKYQEGIICPTGRNPMFYPRSLSASADIPEKLKSRIASIQAPTKGPDYLPAKGYHILASASLACVLLRKGVPEVIAEQITSSAINAYRATTLCTEMKFQQQTLDFKTSPAEGFSLVQEIRKNKSDCQTLGEAKKIQKCIIIKNILGESIIKDPSISEDLLEKKFTNGLARADAANSFFKSWSSLLTLKCNGVQITEALSNFFKANGLHGKTNPCDKNTHPERCANLRKTMDQWAIDFEWSKASHAAGFNFAKQNCDRVDSIETLEKQACQISGDSSAVKGASSESKEGTK